MTNGTLSWTVGMLTLAGFVQGLTGFGFGLVAMGLLPHIISLDDTQGIVTLTSMAACIAMTGVTVRDVQWSGVKHLWLASLVGVPLGFVIVDLAPPELVLRLLGLAILLLVLFEVVATRRFGIRLPDWSGWCLGLAGGALSGAFNIGGPPLVAYVYDRDWTKEQQVATLSALFMSTGIIRVSLLLTSQQLPVHVWQAAAWTIGPMILAIVLGNRLLRYVPQVQLRAAVYLTLLIIAGRYLLAGS